MQSSKTVGPCDTVRSALGVFQGAISLGKAVVQA